MPKSGYKSVKWLFGKEIEIPEEWGFMKLEKAVKLSQGIQVPEEEQSLVKLQNYERFLRIVDFQEELPPRYIDSPKSQYLVEPNNMVMVRYGVGAGNVYRGLSGAIANNLFQIKPKIENLIENFVYYYLKRGLIRELLQNISGSTTMPNINHKLVYNIPIPIPPKKEQEKITSIISNIENLLESYDEIIKHTKRLKHGLMQQLLTKGIGHKKFKKTKLGVIPEEWELENLGNLCQIRKNNNCQSELYVGLEHISQGTNLLVGRGHTSNFSSTKNIFKRGDVLYGKLRPILNKVWLAKEDGFCSTDILPIETNERLDNQILVKIISSKEFVLFASSTSGGTKMPRTNWSDIKKYQIRLPPIHEQQKIASIFSSVDDKITELESKKKSLESLKKGLMQKLLTGKIRVSV